MKVLMVYTYCDVGNNALSVGQYYTRISGEYPSVEEIEEVEHKISRDHRYMLFVKVVNVIPLAG